MKKRIFSMFLCLCMVFTLVGAMVPMTNAAESLPLTDEQITAKITEEYIPAVMEWQEEHGVTKAYWNQRIGRSNSDTSILKGHVDQNKYKIGLTEESCKGISLSEHHGKNCNSNYFEGVHTTDYESQCSGFANYIEYAIFHDVDSETAVDGSVWTKKDTVEDDYNFRPGDLVRYCPKGTNTYERGHSAVIYKVEDEKVHFIECNFRDGVDSDYCIIRWERSAENTLTQSALRAKINNDSTAYVLCPPATLRSNEPPSAPTNVTGKWISRGKAEISWDAAGGAAGYEVEYRTPESGWMSDGTCTSETSYTSTVLGNYDFYQYRVRAVNSGGPSDWIPYTLKNGPMPPDKPGYVSAVWTKTWPLALTASARVSWRAVSGAESYTVGYREKGMTLWCWGPVKSTSETFSGLKKNTSYEFCVKAVNSAGSSDLVMCSLDSTTTIASIVVYAEDKKSGPPSITETDSSAPTGVSGTWTSTGPKWQARISWNAVSGATRYEVQYRTPRTNNEWRADADYSSGTSYISTGLGNYNSYDYRVRAVNASGASGWTEYTLYK